MKNSLNFNVFILIDYQPPLYRVSSIKKSHHDQKCVVSNNVDGRISLSLVNEKKKQNESSKDLNAYSATIDKKLKPLKNKNNKTSDLNNFFEGLITDSLEKKNQTKEIKQSIFAILS